MQQEDLFIFQCVNGDLKNLGSGLVISGIRGEQQWI